MKRNVVLKVLNPILAVLVVNQILTGLLADTLPREAFEILHEGGGILIAIAALLHLALNWGWVRSNFIKSGPVTQTRMADKGTK